MTTTPDVVRRQRAATRCRAALRQGERLWATGHSGSGEIDAIRFRQGRLEGRWRWFERWDCLHAVWWWVDEDKEEEVLYEER